MSHGTSSVANVSVLAIASDTQHLVALTAEDKCVCVFQVDAGSALLQLLSKRSNS